MLMRRVLAVSALGAALVTAAACGNDNGNGTGNGAPTEDGGGTLSTEEVCAAGEELIGEYEAAGAALVTAVATGDEAAFEEAAAALAEVGSQVSQEARGLAADAADPELRAAVETYATELDAFTEAVAADSNALETVDTTGIEAASGGLDRFCG